MERNSSIDLITALSVITVIILAAHAAGIVLCPFRRLTGFPCPGCGSTRAMLHIMQGDITSAFKMNPLAVASTVLIPIGWFFFRKRKISPVLSAALAICAATAVALNWIYLLSQY